MDDDLKDKILEYIDSQIDDAIDSENLLTENASAAIGKNEFEKALLFLNTALLVNPKNAQSKQKLQEIYPKAIQDVIEEGRYDDALQLANTALEFEKTNNKIIKLKLKIHCIKLISKYYPDEELLFIAFWEKIKNISDLNIKQHQFALPGFAFSGNVVPRKKASIILAISALECAYEVNDSEEIKNTINMQSLISDKLIKNKAPKHLIDNFNSFTGK